MESRGFRVVDIDYHASGRSLVRLFIERMGADAASGADSASIGDCTEVSRLVGPMLDAAAELIPGAYDLEVSSPGLDRRLRLASDFEKMIGEEVKLQLTTPVEGRGAMKGKLLSAVGDRVSVMVDGKEIAVPLEKVRRANRVWQFKK